MEKFIVVANFTCHDGCEDDLYTSQWLVGTFDNVKDCLEASRSDLCNVACDHYECVIPEEDYYDDEGEIKEEEYRKAIEDCAFTYCEGRWEAMLGGIEIGFDTSTSVEIMSNDFIDDEFTDQRQIVKYYVYKMCL
jgi:hypothetical protein